MACVGKAGNDLTDCERTEPDDGPAHPLTRHIRQLRVTKQRLAFRALRNRLAGGCGKGGRCGTVCQDLAAGCFVRGVESGHAALLW